MSNFLENELKAIDAGLVPTIEMDEELNCCSTGMEEKPPGGLYLYWVSFYNAGNGSIIRFLEKMIGLKLQHGTTQTIKHSRNAQQQLYAKIYIFGKAFLEKKEAIVFGEEIL